MRSISKPQVRVWTFSANARAIVDFVSLVALNGEVVTVLAASRTISARLRAGATAAAFTVFCDATPALKLGTVFVVGPFSVKSVPMSKAARTGGWRVFRLTMPDRRSALL